MDITVIIPFYNGNEYLPRLLASIPAEWKVIVVDDLSKERPLFSRDNIEVLHLDNKGYFTGAVNAGIEACYTDVLILNQDVYFEHSRAFELVQYWSSKGYDMVGEGILGTHTAWPMGYIHGVFMYASRKLINAVGLMDAENYPLWGSTCEWQLRACRKDFKVKPIRPIPGMVHERKGNFGSSIQTLLADEPDRKSLFVRTPPLISVIAPCYNHGRYIPDLVASLIGGKTVEGEHPGQTLQSFELVIADDCSTDESAEIAKSFVDPWKGIRYVQTPTNSGTSAACNAAIRAAHAPTIARIDCDDMREPQSLETMYKALQENPHSFVYDDLIILAANGRGSKSRRLEDYDFNKLIHKNHVHAGIMFPKKAWKETGGYSEEMRHGRDDWAFNVALGLKGYCGIHVKEAGYIYRRHEENRTLSNTTPRHRQTFYQQIRALYPEAYAEVRPMGCCGGRRNPSVQTQNGGTYSMAKALAVGAEGMTTLEFQGANFGKETYYGPVTGAVYTFSARHKLRDVDDRDLRFTTPSGQKLGLLDLVQNNSEIFKVYKPAVVEPIVEEELESELLSDENNLELESGSLPVEDDLKSADLSTAPDPFVEETSDEIEAYIYPLTKIKSVGMKTAQDLVAAGYYSGDHIMEASVEQLVEDLGWSAARAASLKEAVEDHVTS